ncbi:Hsp20/alpha crystallin family protein [Candidatus Nitrososphaera sp. FF02]|uniref:Hsp20/alpha crystallin family protein n=1 Tax=Candidatus Nitrososphaera sp. FF02 TaxID=3398226 RepID=UPI0039ECCAF2
MKKSTRLAKRDTEIGGINDVFDNFRKEAFAMMNSWPGMSLLGRTRVPLCDIVDRGNRYELHVEVPGIETDKINVKATQNTVEISGVQTEESRETRKSYHYNERLVKSFYRIIPVPGEIDPSKVSAKTKNGVLTVKLPKASSKRVKRMHKKEVHPAASKLPGD